MTPAEAFDRMPKLVRIGPFDFEIVTWTSLESNAARRYGECSTQEQKLRICREMSSCEKLVDTVLHEVLHAIFWAYSIEDGFNEEQTVTRISTAFLSLFRDNPELLLWVNETLRKLCTRCINGVCDCTMGYGVNKIGV
jgi:hypothetical protein